jgi:hypothetical protein
MSENDDLFTKSDDEETEDPSIIEINRANRYRNFHDDGSPLSGGEVIELVQRETPGKVLLSFSGGKDSLCAWLTLREHFDKVIPFHVYRVPNLEWVDTVLDRYETYFGCHIYRVPAPDLYKMLRKHCFIPPHRWPWIEAAHLPYFDWNQVEFLVKRQVGVAQETFTATGVRAVDNIQRRIAVKRYGPIHWGKRAFMPIWDTKKGDVIDILERFGVPLSVEYQWFGHSLGGLDYRYMKPVKDNAPHDWAQIKRYFPLIHLELSRYDDLMQEYPFGKVEHGRVTPK